MVVQITQCPRQVFKGLFQKAGINPQGSTMLQLSIKNLVASIILCSGQKSDMFTDFKQSKDSYMVKLG